MTPAPLDTALFRGLVRQGVYGTTNIPGDIHPMLAMCDELDRLRAENAGLKRMIDIVNEGRVKYRSEILWLEAALAMYGELTPKEVRSVIDGLTDTNAAMRPVVEAARALVKDSRTGVCKSVSIALWDEFASTVAAYEAQQGEKL